MAKNPQEVVFEGWLTKSPPTKRIWRARWRRRWFLLTHSGELPGQYILTYYTDRNCRKLKGVINLDQCEQVDLGLKLDERKLKFDHVFDIKTPTRTYYLAADTDNEMRSWVTCICKVCGLKSTSEEEEGQMTGPCPDVEVTEEPSDRRITLLNNFNETPPVSPVSTSPYIPISECITGKSPIFDPKDFKTLLQYNMKNTIFKSDPITHTNESYELPQRNYLNCLNVQEDPRFYDCPRKLGPPVPIQKVELENEKNHSPLQSPTDSDSVFNDEDWPHNSSSDLNTSKNTRKSESSDDGENLVATKKFTKSNTNNGITTAAAPPPRPPKPAHIAPLPCYLNLTPTKTIKDAENENVKSESQQPKLTDDMYDFPRSHHIETDATLKRRHCYNNAAPVPCPEGTIFRYDISPKPTTSTTVFRYDLEEGQDEPPSPAHSHSSSAPAYSNLPSPSLSVTQLMPPPMVNRELKPKRKLSDSHSISSNPEPPSPRSAPSVDRKLKPPTPLQEAHMRKHFNTEEDQRKIRAAPSPTPPNLGRSHDSLLSQTEGEQVYHYLSGKMQYLDLDLEGSSGSNFTGGNSTKTTPAKQQEDTVYKKVDFMKTQAFNITRNILEKERQEPVTFVKK
ncbi:GRB2-associated-binding protein 1 isoform X1 [Diabrotica virgifera virgifera]|uniref:GRB2-associated-binding protein 1-like n=2 Tax=Diabrotica virgifera virgifera TaxID=50390 RepID=A0A6P7FVH3_DIAVI|nr:GRB2-associated-binding protein 1 isoform X1 [Diabrotica virgifera virgifera]